MADNLELILKNKLDFNIMVFESKDQAMETNFPATNIEAGDTVTLELSAKQAWVSADEASIVDVTVWKNSNHATVGKFQLKERYDHWTVSNTENVTVTSPTQSGDHTITIEIGE